MAVTLRTAVRADGTAVDHGPLDVDIWIHSSSSNLSALLGQYDSISDMIDINLIR